MGPPMATCSTSATPDVTMGDPAICGSALHVLVHVVPPTLWPPSHHGQCFTPAAGRAADVDTPAPAPTTHMRMLCPYCHAAILCSACSTGCRATCPSSHPAATAVPMDADSASPPPPPPEPPPPVPPHPQQQQEPPPPPPPMEPPPPQQPAPRPEEEQPAGEATVTPTPPAVTPTPPAVTPTPPPAPPARLPPPSQKTRVACKPLWAPQPLDTHAHARALAGGAHPGTFGAGPPFAPAGWEWSVGSRRTKSGAAFTDRYLRPSRDFMAEFGGPEPPGWRLDSRAGFKKYVAEHHPGVRVEDAVRAFAWRVPAAKGPEQSESESELESETETESEPETEPEPEPAPAREPRKRKGGAAAAAANKPRKRRKDGAAAAQSAVPERRSLRKGVAAAGGTRRVWRGGRKPVKTVSVAALGRPGAK